MIGSGAWTLRSDSVTSPSKAASRQSGQQARGRSRSALLAKRNQRVSGSCSFWNAGSTGRSRMYQQMPEQQEGAAPASSESATRIRIRPHPLRSPSTTRLRLHRRLRARTGAVQVDVGVAGAVRAPALGAPGRTGEDAAAHPWRSAPRRLSGAQPRPQRRVSTSVVCRALGCYAPFSSAGDRRNVSPLLAVQGAGLPVRGDRPWRQGAGRVAASIT
jgi:hypothetical protein